MQRKPAPILRQGPAAGNRIFQQIAKQCTKVKGIQQQIFIQPHFDFGPDTLPDSLSFRIAENRIQKFLFTELLHR